MDERGHVNELDGRTGRDGGRRVRRRGEKGQRRPEPLPTGCERVRADLRHEARVGGDRPFQIHLDLAEVPVQPFCRPNHLERGQGLVPTWSATHPPPRSR